MTSFALCASMAQRILNPSPKEMDETFRILRSDRKTIAIQIMPNGEVVVRCPRRMKQTEVEAFVKSKASWIEKHRKVCAPVEMLSTEEVEVLRERTRRLVTEKVAHFAPLVGVSFGRIAVRTQRTRWGSCSSKGNLNFNCLLALVPETVLDYIVVHELCHRKEMNHSPAFWAEVERILPDYRTYERWLKTNGRSLIAKL